MKKKIVTHFESRIPTVMDNPTTGYALHHSFVNELTGDKYYQKSSGVWVGELPEVGSGPAFCGPTTAVVLTGGSTLGKVNVSAIQASFNTQDDFSGNSLNLTVPALADISLVPNTYTYLTAQYNAGNPMFVAVTNNLIINHSTILNVAQLYWEQVGAISKIHIFYNGTYGLGLANKVAHRLIHTERFGRENGLVLSVDGSRHVLLTAGRIWYDGEMIEVPEVNTSLSGVDMTFYHHSAGAWTAEKVSVLPNTQFDNGSDLTDLSTGKHAVIYVYRNIDSVSTDTFIVMGTGDYNEGQSLSAIPPAVPDIITKQCMLVGRVIYKKGVSEASYVSSAFASTFQSGAIPEHNSMGGLQSSVVTPNGEYYHITLAQAALIAALTASATELNYVKGVTSPIQEQFAAVSRNLRVAVDKIAHVITTSETVVSQVGSYGAADTPGAVAYTLPAANAVPAGYSIIIVDESGTLRPWFRIAVTPAGTDTIDGVNTTLSMIWPYQSVKVSSDGTSKWTVLENTARYCSNVHRMNGPRRGQIMYENDLFMSVTNTSFDDVRCSNNTGSVNSVGGDGNINYGCVSLVAGTATGNYAQITAGMTSSISQAQYLKNRWCEFFCNFGTIDGTNTTIYRIGFVDNTSGTEPAHGVWIMVDRSKSTTYWVCGTSDNSVRTYFTTAQAIPANGTKFRVGIELADDLSSVRFYIDDVLVANLATGTYTMPGTTRLLSPGAQNVWVAGTGSTQVIDLVRDHATKAVGSLRPV